MENTPSENPNEKLVPIYDGEVLIWVTVPEWYVRNLGHTAVYCTDSED